MKQHSPLEGGFTLIVSSLIILKENYFTLQAVDFLFSLFCGNDIVDIDVESSLSSALSTRHPMTGDWLLRSISFESWKTSELGCMWIYGIGTLPAFKFKYISEHP